MAYSPISLDGPPQYHVNGEPASGYVLKAYSAGTSTLLQMATDSAAGTLVNDIVLNSQGQPAVSGNIVVPHVNANYKLALYATQAAADANSGATWTIDNLTPTGISADQVVAVANLTELRNFTGSSETLVLEGAAAQGDGSGDIYYYASGAAPGTYVDNGTTIIVPSGGDGSAAWLSVGVGTASIEGSFTAHTAGGSANAQTITPNPAITAYSSSVRLAFIPVANNTGACTLKVNSLAAVSIKMLNGSDPPAGALNSSGVSVVQHNGTSFILLNPAKGFLSFEGVTASTAELNILDGVTASTAELNILDGVTATASELNILDGVTATAAEINKLDGVTASTAELNILDGVTATAAEINLSCDGSEESSFTGTLTGMSSSTTGTVNYLKTGKIVYVWITAAISGTSNATTMSMTGLPSSIRPTNTKTCICGKITDASSDENLGIASISSSGVVTFNLFDDNDAGRVQAIATFAGAGTKGLAAGWTITYPVD